MIAIVNYGIGNLDSVLRAFKQCDAEVRVSSSAEEIAEAKGIILPGVGSFGTAMAYLDERGMTEVLNQRVLEDGVPILGICLGFQMLTKHSEEGDVAGLGWIDGETKRFDFSKVEPQPKVPHMGWNDLEVCKSGPLLEGIHPDSCFYFAHSYCVFCNDEDAILTKTLYGYEFVSSVAKGNIFGTQFHPEKSHANGLQLIRNFAGYANSRG